MFCHIIIFIATSDLIGEGRFLEGASKKKKNLNNPY